MPVTVTARRPAAVTASATAASWASVRAAMTTSAPASARATALAAPMPRPAPVTMAQRPCSSNRSRIGTGGLLRPHAGPGNRAGPGHVAGAPPCGLGPAVLSPWRPEQLVVAGHLASTARRAEKQVGQGAYPHAQEHREVRPRGVPVTGFIHEGTAKVVDSAEKAATMPRNCASRARQFQPVAPSVQTERSVFCSSAGRVAGHGAAASPS